MCPSLCLSPGKLFWWLTLCRLLATHCCGCLCAVLDDSPLYRYGALFTCVHSRQALRCSPVKEVSTCCSVRCLHVTYRRAAPDMQRQS